MDCHDVELEYQWRKANFHPNEPWDWSFAYTPFRNLKSAKVMLIGLNGGYSKEDKKASLAENPDPCLKWESHLMHTWRAAGARTANSLRSKSRLGAYWIRYQLRMMMFLQQT